MSWFVCTTIEPFAGSLVATNGAVWGYRRVRLDYDRGGWTEATIPAWLAGFFSMQDRGKHWHRHWRRGEREGWVKVHQAKSAAEIRAEELRAIRPSLEAIRLVRQLAASIRIEDNKETSWKSQ